MFLRIFLMAGLLVQCSKSISQGYIGSISPFTPIKNEEEWTTGGLTAMNTAFITLNIIHFDNNKRRSNAGFMIIPGLFQAGYGILVSDKKPEMRAINIVMGAVAASLSATRLFYRGPKNKQISVMP